MDLSSMISRTRFEVPIDFRKQMVVKPRKTTPQISCGEVPMVSVFLVYALTKPSDSEPMAIPA
jgi:hypothetical protein